MENEQQYCVAATDREDGKRKAITGGYTRYQTAFDIKSLYSGLARYRKLYTYFHVAKYPYKPKK